MMKDPSQPPAGPNPNSGGYGLPPTGGQFGNAGSAATNTPTNGVGVMGWLREIADRVGAAGGTALASLLATINTSIGTTNTTLGTTNSTLSTISTNTGTTATQTTNTANNTSTISTNTSSISGFTNTTASRLLDSSSVSAAERLKNIQADLDAIKVDDDNIAARLLDSSSISAAERLKTVALALDIGNASVTQLARLVAATNSSQQTGTGAVTAGASRLFSITVASVGTGGPLQITDGNGGSVYYSRAVADMKAGDVYNFTGGMKFATGIWVSIMPTGGAYVCSYST